MTIKLMSLFIVLCPLVEFAYAITVPSLILKQNASGSVDHAINIESKGTYNISFEASYNYSLSKWFDTVNDMELKKDLLQNTTDYIPDHQQKALFNQVINPGDFIGHIISAKKYNPGKIDKIVVAESNTVRVILDTTYSPMIGSKVNENITFHTRYIIYPSGKIFIKNVLISSINQDIKEWRNSVVGLGDPAYYTQQDSGNSAQMMDGKFLDNLKNWPDDKWQGFKLNQAGYNSWEILGNAGSTLIVGRQLSGSGKLTGGAYSISSRDDRFGWIRATDLQDPFAWHKGRARYLYIYWDPSTPEPYANWTKASILLVPSPKNPYQGGQSKHGWKGFKRFYYQAGNISLKKGESIAQNYYMQLGTKGSAFLPDLSKRSNTEKYAFDYLGDHSIRMITGASHGSGFDDEKGCYTIVASKNGVAFMLDGSAANQIKPVFEITSVSLGFIPKITVNDKILRSEIDYIWHNDGKGMLLVQVLFDINKKSVITISE